MRGVAVPQCRWLLLCRSLCLGRPSLWRIMRRPSRPSSSPVPASTRPGTGSRLQAPPAKARLPHPQCHPSACRIWRGSREKGPRNLSPPGKALGASSDPSTCQTCDLRSQFHPLGLGSSLEETHMNNWSVGVGLSRQTEAGGHLVTYGGGRIGGDNGGESPFHLGVE